MGLMKKDDEEAYYPCRPSPFDLILTLFPKNLILWKILKYTSLLALMMFCFLSGYFLSDDTVNTELTVPHVTADGLINPINDTVLQDLIGESYPLDNVNITVIDHITRKDRRVIYPNRHFLLINRHYGLGQDMRYLAKKLNFTVDEVKTSDFFGDVKNIENMDFLTESDTNKDIVNRLAEWVCNKYPVVFVADINGDGRFLLQKLDRDPANCKIKKLIFLTTNRFDYHTGAVPGEHRVSKYHDLVKRLYHKEHTDGTTDIIWVANNPYEPKYAEILLEEPLITRVIRPFGVATVEKTELAPHERDKVVTYGSWFTKCYYDELKSKGIQVHQLEHDYGGPLTLSQYRAYIEFPYQVSTMKLYENIAAGVTMLIPSHRFYQELMDGKGPSCADYWGFHLSDNFDYKQLGSDWYEYVDYYHKDFQDYIYYFDSYEELALLLQQPIIDTRNVKERGPAMFKKLRLKSIIQWKIVLEL